MPYYNYRGELMPESAPEAGNTTGTPTGGETLRAPPGPASVGGAGGGDTLIGTTADNKYWVQHPNDRIVDPGGIDTVISWLPQVLQAGVENLVVHGDFHYAVGNELNNLIIVDGSQWIDGSLGDDVLVGSIDQRTTFSARAGGGNDVIYNWNNNSQIHFVDYGFKTTADVRAAMTQREADVVLKLSELESLTIRNATLASFDDRQFLLPLDRAHVGAQTFGDEFDSLQVFDPNTGAGQWRTNFGGNLKDEWAYTLASNGEHQVYVDPGFYGRGDKNLGVNPFSIENGVLSITAAPSPDAYATYHRPYTSGMLNTLGTFSQQYGYFEARVATPNVTGAWPAFWMVPSPWVPDAEADIFEGLGLTPHIDYRRAWGGKGGNETQYDNAFKPDPDAFHTYGMLWTSSNVTFYLDGVAVLTGATPSTWSHPMSLILNLAIGGWGGDPDASLYPAQLKVDYVRAYALSDGSSKVVTNPPDLPIATLRADGPATGQVSAAPLFDDLGQPVTQGSILVGTAQPTSTPPPRTFVIWEEAGAVFGAVSNGAGLSQATTLLAGTAGQFTGVGTWLTTGKVVTAYHTDNGSGGKELWTLVFDPSDASWDRQNLGPAAARSAVAFVATAEGGFAVSWHAPDGSVLARGYDEYAYGGDDAGWYGPVRAISGDLVGVNAKGQLIAADGLGQQLYHLHGAAGAAPAGTAASDDAAPAGSTPVATDAGSAPIVAEPQSGPATSGGENPMPFGEALFDFSPGSHTLDLAAFEPPAADDRFDLIGWTETPALGGTVFEDGYSPPPLDLHSDLSWISDAGTNDLLARRIDDMGFAY